MRIRPFFVSTFPGLLALLLMSCSTGKPARRGTPQFTTSMPMPIGIQIQDARSREEIVGGKREDGFYPSIPQPAQLESFSEDLGNALSGYRAAPQWYLLPSDANPVRHALVLQVELQHWYSRWPTDVDRDDTHVLVDGVCQAKWKVMRNGRVLLKGKQADHLNPLPIPLTAIRADTVAQVIRDALAHQMQKSKRRWIEAMLLDLADDWDKVLDSSN